MPHYSNEQKAIAIGAVQQWGLRPAERWLAQEWPGGAPGRNTLIGWAKAGIVVTEEADAFLTEVNHQRKAKWQGAIDATRDDLIGATAKAAKAGKGLVAQQFATATGIFYDKLVPVSRSGTAVSVAGAGQVNILVAASPSPPGAVHRDIPDDWKEGDVISGDPEGLVEGEK